ncbi:MAG: response regulator [Candidatus Thermochlorobacter sp.]
MKRLLIIEDDPTIQRGLKIALEKEFYHVETVADGEFGFELAKIKDFDLIILDLMLPNKNGIC